MTHIDTPINNTPQEFDHTDNTKQDRDVLKIKHKFYLDGTLLSIVTSSGLILTHDTIKKSTFSTHSRSIVPHLAILDAHTLDLYGIIGYIPTLVEELPINKDILPDIYIHYTAILDTVLNMYREKSLIRDIVVNLKQIDTDKYSYAFFLDRGLDYV